MTDNTNKQPSKAVIITMSRRNLLRGAAIAAGGMAALVGAVVPAAALMPQKAAGYQDKPKGQAMCSNCTHFEPPHSCGIVAGTISPHGWCHFYVKK
jgi:anaerobic selenocysteine-containing dehydrogenase